MQDIPLAVCSTKVRSKTLDFLRIIHECNQLCVKIASHNIFIILRRSAGAQGRSLRVYLPDYL